MNCYLDTSVLLSLIVRDPHSPDAIVWFEKARPTSLVSSFAATEFSAVVSRHVRVGQLTAAEGTRTLDIFDGWLRRNARVTPIDNADVIDAERLVRNFDSKLLAPDALHLSVSQRLGAMLATFDVRLADAARSQGVKVIMPS